MKKILKKARYLYVSCAVYSLMIMSSYSAGTVKNADGLCDFIVELQGVFATLRILAFVGAGFLIAQWAWGYIKDGKVEMKDVESKGTGLIVGCLLLFGVGMVIGFVMGDNGICAAQLKEW